MINFFLHIPKTAGTTLRSIVDAQYGERRVLTYYNQTSTMLLDNLSPYLQTTPFDAMIGHFPFGVHASAPDGYRYYTFLREPAPLVMSTYGEVMKAAGPTSIPQVAAEQLTLIQALDRFESHFENLQTRYILGIGPEHSLPEDAFEQACARLEAEFALVGIVERFDEAILMMSKELRWKPCIYRRQNVGSGESLDESIRDRVIAITEVDRCLYRWAAERFAQLVDREGPAFSDARTELQQALAAADDGKRAHYQAARIVVDGMPAVGRYLADSQPQIAS